MRGRAGSWTAAHGGGVGFSQGGRRLAGPGPLLLRTTGGAGGATASTGLLTATTITQLLPATWSLTSTTRPLTSTTTTGGVPLTGHRALVVLWRIVPLFVPFIVPLLVLSLWIPVPVLFLSAGDTAPVLVLSLCALVLSQQAPGPLLPLPGDRVPGALSVPRVGDRALVLSRTLPLLFLTALLLSWDMFVLSLRVPLAGQAALVLSQCGLVPLLPLHAPAVPLLGGRVLRVLGAPQAGHGALVLLLSLRAPGLVISLRTTPVLVIRPLSFLVLPLRAPLLLLPLRVLVFSLRAPCVLVSLLHALVVLLRISIGHLGTLLHRAVLFGGGGGRGGGGGGQGAGGGRL